MKKLLSVLLSFACLLGLCTVSLHAKENEVPEAAPAVSALHTTSNRIVDSSGKPVVLNGISTHGLAWFGQILNQNSFSHFKNDFGLNAVRLALYTQEYGGYCTGGSQAQLEALIDQGVNLAVANGMYCIIDWHILSDGNPLTHADQAKAFFEKEAQRYGKVPNVIFEICNEPNGGTTWQQISQYAAQIIPVIRAHSNNLILVGTPTWSQEIDKPAASPLPYSNVAYTLHFYAGTHKDDLRNRYAQAADRIPVVASEYGITAADGNSGIDIDNANKWMNVLDQHQTGRFLWSASNKNEGSAILKPSASLENWSLNDLSTCGQWLLSRASHSAAGNPNPALPGTPAVPAPSLAQSQMSLAAANSWPAGSDQCTQLSATVTATGKGTTSMWAFVLKFPQAITVNNHWNGKVSQIAPDTLLISSMDYNAKLNAGSRTGDIGLIIQSAKAIDPASVQVSASGQGAHSVIMQRLYNPNSGEHFYTKDVKERDALVYLGWKYEGAGWIAPTASSTPVYRLYNPNAGDHHYTMDVHERTALIQAGWKDEGIGWYSADQKEVALLRQYNPNARSGAHNFTASQTENDALVRAGWKDEGISWYGLADFS